MTHSKYALCCYCELQISLIAGEVLYSFLKVGDSVCIGRDKRQCKIALGVNAQGVSRVHLKLELLSNGHVSSR